MDDKEFILDLTLDINERLDVFERELLNLENTTYRHIFNQENRLWNHYNLCITYNGTIPTAAFGFKDSSDLHYTVKENIFDIFSKHFPDGKQTSLTGYPQNHF